MALFLTVAILFGMACVGLGIFIGYFILSRVLKKED